ncbi:MAG: DNA photolyase family protein [Thiovulaceae bacterium]|nr:DNA photolyase family protein [Sulfurimonadaceae bacterium]
MRRILWFRRDLRLKDNPLLALGGELLPIFIFDENILKPLPKDDKRVSFIFSYVQKLKQELLACGLELKVFYGKPNDVFDCLLKQHSFDEVAASGDYDSYAKERDVQISHKLYFRYIQDTYIFQHNEVLKDDGSPYLVFTPFYKKARIALESKNIDELLMAEHTLADEDYDGITKVQKEITTLPFEIGSIGFEKSDIKLIDPHLKLEAFKEKLGNYKEQRDYLWSDVTSHLSVDLRFGTIGVREVLRFLFANKNLDIEPFIRQLIFRDFYAYELFHMPRIENENYRYSFNGIEDEEKYKAFCEAKTGVPIVDAGVRELLHTGNMHNRVRMVAASFFTKDLLLPWQWGEKFFAQHLLDYDKASNVLSWQWSAGTGVDPQPYFRVFNPYLQSKKFDKEGLYIKQYVPELRHLESKYLHDEGYLFSVNIKGYPKPMLQHKEAAKKAIEVFRT